MKVFIFGVFLGLVVTVWSVPINNINKKLDDEMETITIIRSISENNTPDGIYSYSFEGEEGIKADESGPQFEDVIGTIFTGSYSSADGTPINVVWT